MGDVEIIKVKGFSRDCVSLTKRAVPANGINLRAKFASMRIRSACISRQAHISLPRDPACVHARTHARTRRECEDAGSHEFRYRGLGKSISMSLSAALLKATACSENKKELRLPSSTQA